MILATRLRSHGKHSTARGNHCKGCRIKRRSRRSLSLQFCVRDLHPRDLTLVTSGFALAMLAVTTG